jgi:hypothetical protein
MDTSRLSEPAAPRPTHPWVTAGGGTVRFGVAQLTPLVDWSAYLRVVEAAEALGFDSYWTYRPSHLRLRLLDDPCRGGGGDAHDTGGHADHVHLLSQSCRLCPDGGRCGPD